MCELLHELSNYLRLRISGNSKKIFAMFGIPSKFAADHAK